MVLFLPRLEPRSHLLDLFGDVVVLADGWRYVGVGNLLDAVVSRRPPARHTEAVVVVARAELDPVEDGDELTESDGADVVGVVVHGGHRHARVRLGVVGACALVVMPHLREEAR